jgi:hypothetical protein
MRKIRAVHQGLLAFVISSLSLLAAAPAGAAQDEAAPPPPEQPPAAPPPAAEKPAPEMLPPAAPPEDASPPANPNEITVAEFHGWKFTIEGRVNLFLSFGKGQALPQTDKDGVNLGEGGGLGLNQNQTNASGNFATPRLRNGFVPNIITFRVSRQLSSDLKATAVLSLWSDIETNLSIYAFPQAYMQEGYMNLEGSWGSFTAGRQLALYSRGAVEIDSNYAHNYGVGWPCNFNFIYATCGQIGFGALFPFFRAGALYTTPSFGGLTLALGAYDPVILAGKWERVILPTFEAEAAWVMKFGHGGMLKLFGSGLWQRLGGAAAMLTLVNKHVDQIGGAIGGRLEVGPLRLGVTGHYGKGLGFYYAQENTQAAYYTASGDTDPNLSHDGDLRTFQGYYAQAMVVLGKIDIGAGIGASQAIRFPFEVTSVPASGDTTGVTHPPKQNLGANGVLWVHVADNLIWDIDYFRAVYSWWGASFTQTIDTINTGLTLTF